MPFSSLNPSPVHNNGAPPPCGRPVERRTADTMSLLSSPSAAGPNDGYNSPIVLPKHRALVPMYSLTATSVDASTHTSYSSSSAAASVASFDTAHADAYKARTAEPRHRDAGTNTVSSSSLASLTVGTPSYAPPSSVPAPNSVYSTSVFSPMASTSGRLVLPAPMSAPGRDAMGFPVGVVHDGRPVSSMHGGSLYGGGRSVSSLVLSDGLPPLPSGLSNPLSWTSEGSVASTSIGATVSYLRSPKPVSRPATVAVSGSVSVGGGVTCHSPIRVSKSLSQQSYQYDSPQVRRAWEAVNTGHG